MEQKEFDKLDSTDKKLNAIFNQKEEMLKWFKKAKSLASDFDEAWLRTALDFENYRKDEDLIRLARN